MNISQQKSGIIRFLRLSGIFAILLFLNGTVVPGEETAFSDRTVMISSHSPDQIAILDANGQTLWAIGTEEGVVHPQDAAVTGDGNVFFSIINGAKMVRLSDKRLLWCYTTPGEAQNPVAQPLENGLFLVGNEGPCKLLEIDSQCNIKQEIQVNDCPFKGTHGQFRFCRKTPEGTYLFPMINAQVLREYDKNGKKLRDFPTTGMSVSAIRLPNGDTLTGDNATLKQFDVNNQIIWQFDCVTDGHQKPGLITAIQRLKNGNTVFGYYQDDPEQADIMEVSPDKKIVWSLTLEQISLVAAVQILDKNLNPSPETLAR